MQRTASELYELGRFVLEVTHGSIRNFLHNIKAKIGLSLKIINHKRRQISHLSKRVPNERGSTPVDGQ